MTSASDDGERFCPLCLEEMDLTDQQLKACKCGYDVCLLCWHHLIEVAEKEGGEGRCPACRTPYDKPKILGMGVKCERVIAEMNAKKKQKSQKAKTKVSADAKKHLSTVRVIQRNLVYIIGLPSNLCDENILEHKEYFGQYGKVLKVSISRPSGTASQQVSNNNTFSVYITYAKEEEAIRCIQSVHNYVLDGKSLRACFGTTKYCHAWLRNMPCSNPDCLYLHDIGNQEDSFTKDDIISAYTRSRVLQIPSIASQKRAGNVLPPVDDFNGGSKNQTKSTLNANASQVKVLPPILSISQPSVLPAGASWGLKGTNSRLSAGSVGCSPTSSIDHNIDRTNHLSMTSMLDESIQQCSAWHDEGDTEFKAPESRIHISSSSMISGLEECSKQPSAWHDEVDSIASKLPENKNRVHINGISRPNEHLRIGSWKDSCLNGSLQYSLNADFASRPSAWDDDSVVRLKDGDQICASNLGGRHRPVDSIVSVTEKGLTSSSDHSSDMPCTSETFSSSLLIQMVAPKNSERGICTGSDNQIQHSPMPKVPKGISDTAGLDHVSQETATTGERVERGLCSTMSLLRVDNQDRANQLIVDNHLASNSSLLSSEISRSQYSSPSLASPIKDSLLFNQVNKRESTDNASKSLNSGLISESNEKINPPPCYEDDRLRHSDATYVLSSSPTLNFLHGDANFLSSTSSNGVGYNQTSSLVQDLDMKTMLSPSTEKVSVLSNGYKEDELNGFSLTRKVYGHHEFDCSEEKIKSLGTVGDMYKDDKSATPSTDAAGESSIISDILSLKFDPWDDSLFIADNFARLLGETDKQERSFNLSSSQNANQSRFAFARQESQATNEDLQVKENIHEQKYFSLQNEFQDPFQTEASFSIFDGRSSNNVISSDRVVGISKAKVSAPPGFSAPIRAPPPGFPSQDRFNQYDTLYSENYLHGNSALGNHYQAHSVGSSGDVEFIDPAILAVGKGRMPLGINNSTLNLKSAFPSQLSTSDGDPRLYLLMQQSLVSHQNLRIADHLGDRFLPINDAYVASRLITQNHASISPFAQMPLQQQRNSHFTNSQWDGWNELRTGNDMGISEILLNERLGINNYYSANEDNKFHIPNGDIYNRAFGM